MRIIVILATYNQERFIAGCIEHYAQQGVDVHIIDNGSTDRTVAIAEQYRNKGLIGLEHLPRGEFFNWKAILKRKEELAATLDADWFMHADPDEARLPPRADWTLAEAFEYVDQLGYNAANFLEFTFIPVQESPDHDHSDFQQTMRWYYPFFPAFPHRVNAWKRQSQSVEIAWSGGHVVRFHDLRLYPKSFPMRHYQFLSVPHAIRKYASIKYDPTAVRQGWHSWRAQFHSEEVTLPSQDELHYYTSDGALDWSKPRTRHYLDEAIERAKRKSYSTPRAPSQATPTPFIVGLGRSGTTLLRLMLDSHPLLAIPPETHFINEVAMAVRNAPDPAEAFITSITTTSRWGDFHLDKALLQQEIISLQPFNLSEAFRTFYRLYAQRFGKPRWGDKSTVAYCAIMGEIESLLPEAHFIHLIRDGRDRALSVIKAWWGPTTVEEAANQWVTNLTVTRAQAGNVKYYLEILYEDLVRNPESTLRTICEFIDLPYDPVMLEYYRNARERLDEFVDVVATKDRPASTKAQRLAIHELTNRPPDPGRIGRWQREMASSDLARFEKIAGRLLAELHYPLGSASQTSLAKDAGSSQTIEPLKHRIELLEAQLKAVSHIAEVASREVETLHNGRFYKLAKLYWEVRDRILGRHSPKN